MAMQQMLGPISGSSDYEIERSLRFNSADSAYLNRTPSSAGNRKTWTWSNWIKKTADAASPDDVLFTAGTGTNTQNRFLIKINTDDKLTVGQDNGGTFTAYRSTNQVFRDYSSWGHLIVAFDSTSSTASDRLKIYWNGVQITSFNTNNTVPLNTDSFVNHTNPHNICNDVGSYHGVLNCYLADINFIDGQALAPSDFGELNDDGVWNPKRYSGSYGTNGFHLDFSDNSSASALGTDTSGNSNTWTVNNLSVASGSGNDSLIDTPTNYEASSGNNGGNYCTWNPLEAGSGFALSNGNLDASVSSGWRSALGTFAIDVGKWYYEFKLSAVSAIVGICGSGTARLGTYIHNDATAYVVQTNTGTFYRGSSGTVSSGFTWSAGDIVQIAYDGTNNKIWVGKNNSWYGDPSAGTGEISSSAGPGSTGRAMLPVVSLDNSSSGVTNFGQRPFSYTPPTGFKSLCTTNLPAPTFADGSTAMDVVLYTGDGSTQTISGLGFSPDLVWVKQRNTSRNHQVVDTVRGATKDLRSNSNAAETTTSTGLTAFTSDGFTLGGDTGYNQSSGTYVGWTWDAGANSNKTFTVKVVSDSGNKYRFDDFGTSAVTLELEEGSTYVFDQSDSSNGAGGTHPLRFSTTSDGTHNSGSEYTTGVTVTGTPGQSGAKTTITVASGAPTLYYYCSNHSGMGGQANTNSTAGASNLDGTIQATVRANQSAGFSIVSYTGNGVVGATIGHGLNAVPELMIVKRLDSTPYGIVYHKYIDATAPADYLLKLFADVSDGGDARLNASGAWNDTAPTSSVFTVRNNSASNLNGASYIAYIWAPVSGYSAMGSYTGNGSSDGAFNYTGFRPRFIMYKESTNTGNWNIHDTSRNTYNQSVDVLFANLDNAETDSPAGSRAIDVLANGFKIRGTDSDINTNSETYVWIAYAEHPFKTARAR